MRVTDAIGVANHVTELLIALTVAAAAATIDNGTVARDGVLIGIRGSRFPERSTHELVE